MPGSFHIGRIAGIRIDINYSWLIILVLLTVSLATSWFPATIHGLSTATYWIIGLIAALLLFASVLAHELAHSLVARARGLPVKSITLFIFGGVSNLEHEPRSAGIEFQIAVVGPLTSLIIGAIAWIVGRAVASTSRPLAAILIYLGITNVLLAVFNLIPGFPLDGGRVLRSILWGISGNLRTATRWAARVGQLIAYLFILAGIWQFFVGNFIDGLWIGFIGWFLLTAAHTADTQAALESLFRGVTVGEVMNPLPITVPPDMPLQQLMDEYLLPRGRRAALIMDNGQLAGLITLCDIRHIPREQWPLLSVSAVMVPRARLHIVRPQQSLNDVLPLMATWDINQVPVLQDGDLVGMLSRDAIVRFLELRRGLHLDEAQRLTDEELPRVG
jgi:Zn-dependent protease/predicted transcriptional regulator